MESYVGINGETGQYNSMIVVNGHPAIAHYDKTHKSLLFRRSLDSNGTVWANPIAIDEEWSVGQYVSLDIVNGNPAVIYFDETHGNIVYKRALDINGATWGERVVLENVASNYGDFSSLEVINGKPAVSYYNSYTDDLKYMIANDVNGSSWGSAIIVDFTGNVGSFSSLSMVAGKPAIAYYDATNDDLKFVRSLDSDGLTWGLPQIVDATGDVGNMPSLSIINGNPAIAYWGATGSELKYVRATDVEGLSWNTPLSLDAPGSTGHFPSLVTVNGRPAVSYRSSNVSVYMKFIRANDANGSSWGAPLIADSGDLSHSSMTIVNGRPAIAYGDETNWTLKYKRAANSDGTSWPGTEPTFEVSGQLGWYLSMTLVDGKPAAAYYDRTSTNNNVRFVRATDISGSDWSDAVNVTPPGAWGGTLYSYSQFTSLAIVNGNPAIAFLDMADEHLKYVRANDTEGNSWGTPVEINIGIESGEFSSLTIINGNPAVAFYDQTANSLKYVRALDPDGVTWGLPVVVNASGGEGAKLLEVNGAPAIAFFDDVTANLSYVRANDPDGVSWMAPVFLDYIPSINRWLDFEMVNGNPAIAYYKANTQDLLYVRANDLNGATWSSSVLLDDDCDAGMSCDLAVINGNPAIAYHNDCDHGLFYIAAADASGSSWLPKEEIHQETNITAGNLAIELIQLDNGHPGIGFLHDTKSLPMFTSTGICSPLNLTIDQINTTLTSLETGASFQWLYCDNAYAPLSGFTNSSMTALTTGNYAVEITKNGCVDTSLCLLIDNNDFYNEPDYTPMYGEVFALPVSDVDSCDATAYGFSFGGVSPYNYEWYTQVFADQLAVSDTLCHGLHVLKVTDNIGDSLFVDYYVADQPNYYNWYDPLVADDTLYLAHNNCIFDFSLPLDSIFVTDQYFVSAFASPLDFYHIEITYYQGSNVFVFQDTLLMDPLLTNLIDFTVYCPAKSVLGLTKFLFIDGYATSVGLFESWNDSQLTIYPNPSSGIFYLRLSGQVTDQCRIEIFTASMVKISDYSYSEVFQEGFIDLSHVAPGIYFVRVSDSDFSSNRKIVVQ